MIAIALGAGLVVAAVAPAGAPAAVPAEAITSATYGPAEIWLQRRPSDHTQRELVFAPSGDAAPRMLAIAVPPRDMHASSDWAENLALGLDADDRLTAVLQSRRGLYRTHVTAPRLHRVSGTTRQDSFPSIFRGRLAYGHRIGRDGSEVRLRSLSGGGDRTLTVWSNGSDPSHVWVARETAIGAGDAVAIVAVRDGAAEGGYEALLARRGHKTRRLLNLGLGDTHTGGLDVAVSRGGSRLTVTRELDDSTTQISYALPSGRRIG